MNDMRSVVPRIESGISGPVLLPGANFPPEAAPLAAFVGGADRGGKQVAEVGTGGAGGASGTNPSVRREIEAREKRLGIGIPAWSPEAAAAAAAAFSSVGGRPRTLTLRSSMRALDVGDAGGAQALVAEAMKSLDLAFVLFSSQGWMRSW